MSSLLATVDLAATQGWLAALPTWLSFAVVAAAVIGALFLGAPLWAFGLLCAAIAWSLGFGWPVLALVLLCFGALALRPLRRALVTRHIAAFLKRANLLPSISDTEREAIEAGDVWIDGELFSGKPDLTALSRTPWPKLSDAEQAFLDGPVETVCRMTDDWQVWQERDLPREVWDFLGQQRFFGMIVPESFGGLGFSASAHSAVIQKLAAHSMPLAITVMVPNSLGPAELILHHGTPAQKQRWLPRLARGEEIPCFALTEPMAGSDAASMEARGVVFRDANGQLALRLNWNKRYITLAAIATVLGLAFKLEDPDELLGKGKKLGITCALIPTGTPGVELGRRHDPLGVPFYNCPTTGKDVVVPIDAIIGGADGAGRGWRMLMECLAAGRGISLPATSTGGAKLVARAVGAYAAVRKQFGLEIGRFEGIEEKLARIGGYAYMLDAARQFVTGGLDAGLKPPVVTAMAKYQFTELFRESINDGMDVQGGAAISRGPNNTLAHAYVGAPISITVEGANVLTRTLMVFGQGAIRCHPFARREIESLAGDDLRGFDRAFFAHVGLVIRNAVRSVLLSLTRGRLARSPVRGPTARHWRRIAWASATFATLADLAMAGLGGDLKRKEKVTGRFADVFSWMMLITATLRRFEAEGRRREDLPLCDWCCEQGFARMAQAMQGIVRNLRIPFAGWLLRGPVAVWGRLGPLGHGPHDGLSGKVARALLQGGEQRDRLTAGIARAHDAERGLGRLEHAMQLCAQAAPVLQKVKDAVRSKALPKAAPERLLDDAVQKGIVTAEEAARVREAETVRRAAVEVDSFSLEDYLAHARGAVEHAG
ncbi:MAG: acyl-CoA dehydrogenase [Planctomycetota bacterium]